MFRNRPERDSTDKTVQCLCVWMGGGGVNDDIYCINSKYAWSVEQEAECGDHQEAVEVDQEQGGRECNCCFHQTGIKTSKTFFLSRSC